MWFRPSRIGALGKSHAVITEDDAQAASLRSLLEAELGEHAETRAGRVMIEVEIPLAGPNHASRPCH